MILKKALFLYLVISCYVCGGYAQTGFLPVISNYTEQDYHGALQNWDATQDERGVMFFGNNNGLINYDGYNWSVTPLPRKTVARSLLSISDKVYVGTFEDFGYFERNITGDLIYKSLTGSVAKDELKDQEFWKIIKIDSDILFQSFRNIFVFNEESGSVKTIPLHIRESQNEEGGEFHPLFCFEINGILYAQRILGGFYRYTDEGWEIVWPLSLYGSRIIGICRPENFSRSTTHIPEETLLFTEDDLIYKVDNGIPVPFKTEVDEELQIYRINRITDAPDYTIYIGTVGNGIFHIDREGHLIDHFTTSNGLQNNTVLGLLADKDGNIWATLDDGISLIHSSLPVRILHPGVSDPYLGMVYDVVFDDDRIIAATNQGAYQFEGNFNIIPDTKGQNWFVKKIDDQVFIGGNDKTLLTSPDGNTQIIDISGTDIKKAQVHGQEVILQSSYYPLFYYNKDENGKWKFADIIDGLDTPVRQFEIDNDGTLWCSHWTNGLLRTRISADLKQIEFKKYYPNLSGDSLPQKCYVMKMHGKTVFSDEDCIYEYNESTDTFEPSERLNKLLANSPGIKRTSMVDDNYFWTASNNSYDLIDCHDGLKIAYSIPMDLFPRVNNGDNSNIFVLNRKAFFPLSEGVGMVDFDKIEKKKNTSILSFNFIGSLDPEGRLIKFPLNENSNVELEHGNLIVSLSFPVFNKMPYKYRFHISGSGLNKDTVITRPEMIYPVLKGGSYNLECSVISPSGEEIDTIHYSFKVLNPWFLRWWAWLIYVLLFIGGIYIISKLNSRLVLKKRQQLYDIEKEKQETRIKEQALIIANQEKRILESQLSSKSKELASMALGAYARQQVIDNLRESLADIRKKGSATAEAERVLREMSGNATDNRVFWDVFEKNFDLIHEKFFRNLRIAYPNLTPADMKFCALLRMNMSTKEISSFTNLSIRGVETARYRLRKKFGLRPEVSLVQFLIDFNNTKIVNPENLGDNPKSEENSMPPVSVL